MKKSGLLFSWAIVAAVLLFPLSSKAQWVQKGPFGGTVYAFAVDSNKTYVGTEAGVCMSLDSGMTWSVMNLGLTDTEIHALAICGDKLFAASHDSGVYVFQNGYTKWSRAGLNVQVSCFAVKGDTIYAGTDFRGVFVSTDKGTNWSSASNGLTDGYIRSIAVNGGDVLVGTADNSVFKSTDNGANWSPSTSGLPAGLTPYALSVVGSAIYAGIWASGIYVSTDGGANWQATNGGLETNRDYHFYSFVSAGGKLYAGGAEGVYYSGNGGAGWVKANIGLPDYTEVNALASIGSSLLAGVTNSSVFVSRDEASTWKSADRGLARTRINAIAANGGKLFAGADGGLFTSSDQGSTWSDGSVVLTDRYRDITAVTAHGNDVYAGDINGYVYYSSDNGDTWNDRGIVKEGCTVSSFAFIGDNLFASTKSYLPDVAGGVFESTDKGQVWRPVNNGRPTLADTNTYVSALAVVGTSLFSGGAHGVYRSNDNGANWSQVNSGIGGNYGYAVRSLAVRGTELFAAVEDTGIYRSTDNGNTWTRMKLNKHAYTVGVVDTNVFAGTYDGVYILANSDSSWRLTGLPNNPALAFAAADGYLYAGTPDKVWESQISGLLTGVEGEKGRLPEEFTLSQNYPNPFNPTTVIRYDVPRTGLVTLKVYDVLGREVKTLVNRIEKPGAHEVRFDGAGLSSGVYFYRLSAGSFSRTIKMMLLK